MNYLIFNFLTLVLIIKYGIEFFFAYIIPLAFELSHITSLMFIGKLYSLDLFIKFFKFDPFPDIKIQVFFFTILNY